MADRTPEGVPAVQAAEVRTLGERLRARRKALVLTQGELAARLEVGQQTVGRWENGDPPQRRHWRALAAFLDLDEGDLPTLLGHVGPRPTRVDPVWHAELRTAIAKRIAEGGPLTADEIAFFRELLDEPARSS